LAASIAECMPSSGKVTEPLDTHFRSSVLYRTFCFCALALTVGIAACRPPARQYELRGVVVSVDAARQEITIKHEDIPRFMPGMTMPFKVRDRRLLEGRVPGDLVRATLVVQDADAYLRTLERTGSASVPPNPAASLADILHPGNTVPDGTFTDETGAPRKLTDWRGQALAVTFIYTRCPVPNFCPLMDQHFKQVQESVAGEADLRGRVHLLSISFDPDYDRPPVLAARARQLGANGSTWTFLTGDRTEIERFASRFGISVIREEGSPQEIVHNLRTAVIDPNGQLVTIFGGNEWTPQELVGGLRKALGR
jgi:protein SCO1